MKRVFSVLVLFILVLTFPLTSAAGSFNDLIQEGDSQYTDGNYRQALTAYNEAINIDDSQAELYEKKARCLFELNRYKEALVAVTRSLEISGNSSTALSLKRDIEKKMGISDESEAGTDVTSDGLEDSASGITINEDGSGSINLDDYQLFNALYLKDGKKEYLTFVPIENECEQDEENGIYGCPGPYSEYLFHVEYYPSVGYWAYTPGKEKEFLAKRLGGGIIKTASIEVERESYNNKYQYYQIEGYSGYDGNYWVAVHRLIDDIVISFHFLYADQKTSDADQDIQKYMIESLERYERKGVDSSETLSKSSGSGSAL
jgi:tetratricopeptide (TPR) repeat protein